MTQSQTSLLGRCDLAKDRTSQACCAVAPSVACHLKRHTMTLKRYGHFGKMPTSAALMLREAGARGLTDLRDRVYAQYQSPAERAFALERKLSAVWRIKTRLRACSYLP